MTKQELVDGALAIGLLRDGEEADSVRFYMAGSQSDLTIMAGGDTVYGVTLSEDGKKLSLFYIYGQPIYQLNEVAMA